MVSWGKGRGLLGPMTPLLGRWESRPEWQQSQMPSPCTRRFEPLGKGWIQLEAVWRMGARGDYRETALFGPAAAGELGFFSFTSDGKRSEGRRSDASDVHPQALAFEAQMPAGLARSLYWPLDDGLGFNFAVESRAKAGWSRFLRQEFRPASPTED